MHPGLIALMVVVTVSVFVAGAYGVKTLIKNRRDEKIRKKKKWLSSQSSSDAVSVAVKTSNINGDVPLADEGQKMPATEGTKLTLRKVASKETYTPMTGVSLPTNDVLEQIRLQGTTKIVSFEDVHFPALTQDDLNAALILTEDVNDGVIVEPKDDVLISDWKPVKLKPDREVEVGSIVSKSEELLGSEPSGGTGTLSNRTPRKIRDVEPDSDDLESVSPTSPLAKRSINEPSSIVNQPSVPDKQPEYNEDGHSITSRSFGSTHSIAQSSRFTATSKGTGLTANSMASIASMNTINSPAASDAASAGGHSIANSDVYTESRDMASADGMNGSPISDPIHSVVERSPNDDTISSPGLSPNMAESPLTADSLEGINDKFGAIISETLKLDLSPDSPISDKYHKATSTSPINDDHNQGNELKDEAATDIDEASVRSPLSLRIDSDDTISESCSFSPSPKVAV